MKRNDSETFALTDPAKALAVCDRATKAGLDVAEELDLTPQAISAWRTGKVEQLSMAVARKVRRLDRRIK